MPMKLVGISHHTAPLHVRERFVFDHEHVRALTRRLMQEELASEVVLLSTCNRSELYYVAEDDTEPLHQLFVNELAERGQIAPAEDAADVRQTGPRSSVPLEVFTTSLVYRNDGTGAGLAELLAWCGDVEQSLPV